MRGGCLTADWRVCVQNKAFEVEANWFSVQEGTFEAVKDACVAGGGVLASINSLAEAEIAGRVCGKPSAAREQAWCKTCARAGAIADEISVLLQEARRATLACHGPRAALKIALPGWMATLSNLQPIWLGSPT